MSYNGSGVYTLPGAQLVNGAVVSATENNTFRNDVATALNTAWTRDGQAPATANIPMNSHKFTGLSAGTSDGDSVRYEQVTSDVAITGGTISADSILSITYKETKAAISASNIDLNVANYFSKTISGSTTFTVSNVPSTNTVASFILDLTNGGSAAITWWSNVKWVDGVAPTLTYSGRDTLGFFTYDNGSTWTALVLGKDIK